MKIISVAGSGSGCGKTTVVCGLLRAIPGMGAVKISPREHPLRIEWGAGEAGKDTELFTRSGAVRVARIVGPREEVAQAWDMIKDEFRHLRGVVVEGTRGIELPEEKLRIFIGGNKWLEALEDDTWKTAAESALILELSPHPNAESLENNAFITHQVKYAHGHDCSPYETERLQIDLAKEVRDFLG